jgi:hypothetical protein
LLVRGQGVASTLAPNIFHFLDAEISLSRRVIDMARTSMNRKKKKPKGTPGPKGERLVIAGNWKDAVKRSFKKTLPKKSGK